MKKELEKKYKPSVVEENKYDFGKNNGYFKARFDTKKHGYSILIPPPNVTGKLHLGHAGDTTLQDLLIRYKKMKGYDTLYLPGMDHAGIATQIKVEQRLKEQGISRFDLGRQKFIEKVWEGKEEYAQTIRNQGAKLGLSLDYTREKFTYSQDLNELVNFVFVEMYKKGLIYKSKKIVNGDPVQKTAISNMEVIYKETSGFMYHFKYNLENDATKFLQIATTRPETMFGDVCVVVHPKDKRYKDFIGKKVINPVNNALIPVIADDYVDIEFGTGAMKCTPAHDSNDYILGQKYNLEQLVCMNEDARMNEICGEFEGLNRIEAREKIIEKLSKQKLFIKKEEILHQVGYSERSDVVVEPYLSMQGFVKMDELAANVLKLQNSKNAINFFPKRFDETLRRGMENVNDWTISRQLGGGHQIPAGYHKKTKEMYVGLTPPEDEKNGERDEDVLDTGFSSALGPFATLNGFKDKNNKDFKHFFPTSVLVTGYDIIFFGVARMIFQTQEFIGEKPFEDVLIHGLIRDEEGRKMSKSLGNGVDPMNVIDEYGADTLRHFLLTNSSPGQDLNYSDVKLRASGNFINKIGNAARYVMLNIDKVRNFQEINQILKTTKSYDAIADKGILNRLVQTQKNYFNAIEKYEFTIAGKLLYKFIGDDYCSGYVELTKADLNSNDITQKKISQSILGFVLKEILLMLNPIIPFVTEEIYQLLDLKKSIFEEKFSDINFDFKILGFEEIVLESITKIREFRTVQKIKNTQPLNFTLNASKSQFKNEQDKILKILNKYANTMVNASISTKIIEGENTSIQVNDCFLEILNSDFIDKEKQLTELLTKKQELEQELARSLKILSNPNFIAKADPKKVQIEQEKAKTYQIQFDLIVERIKILTK